MKYKHNYSFGVFFLFNQDECDQLTLTVSKVMEEAGDKVEGNIDEIKTNYTQRMSRLENIIKKV